MLILTRIRSSARPLFLCAILGATAVLSTSLPASPHVELLEDRAALDAQIRGSQNPASLFLERAGIHRELGDPDAALLDLQRALRFGASLGEVSLGRAEVLLSRGDLLGAEKEASTALKADPKNGGAQAVRARSRMERGLYQLAADDFGGAATLMPRRPLDLVFARSEAYAELPDNGRMLALGVIEAELESRGSATSLHLKAFEHERALGLYRAALERLDVLRAQGWSKARYGLMRGDVLRDSDDLALAKAAWSAGLGALDQLPVRRRTTRSALQLRALLEARLGGDQ